MLKIPLFASALSEKGALNTKNKKVIMIGRQHTAINTVVHFNSVL